MECYSFRSSRSFYAHSHPCLNQSFDLVTHADTSSSLPTSTSVSDSPSSSLSPESDAKSTHQLLVTGLVLGFIDLIIVGVILCIGKENVSELEEEVYGEIG
ncbi:hypothetical protein K435DRAFT_970433 [Dendrothele bispora CBS 962.96]|uniref:Transmembrane protein n=1 Tax=Dendrothele bispora (strain CBS 962.96) TaxID=1314807 RepID=A0A4S8LBE6_DENBC|nr:hypothetical protein K435DRAFT_970433 [Dendrothele bispora CBS 962.96]